MATIELYRHQMEYLENKLTVEFSMLSKEYAKREQVLILFFTVDSNKEIKASEVNLSVNPSFWQDWPDDSPVFSLSDITKTNFACVEPMVCVCYTFPLMESHKFADTNINYIFLFQSIMNYLANRGYFLNLVQCCKLGVCFTFIALPIIDIYVGFSCQYRTWNRVTTMG